MSTSRFLHPAMLMAALFTGTAAHAQFRYGLTDLNALVDATVATGATDINDRGQILIRGYHTNTTSWLYTPGQGTVDLTDWVPSTVPRDSRLTVTGYDLNDLGQVVGEWHASGLGGNRVPFQTFVYSQAGGMTILNDRTGSGIGLAINNAGLMAGQWNDVNQWRAYLHDIPAGTTDLAPGLQLNYRDIGINESGRMTASFFLPDGSALHAAVYDRQNGITDLGTLGGRNAYATDINETGWVVGESDLAGFDPTGIPLHHPFLYRPGTGITDLGTLASHPELQYGAALALNDSGQAVGYFSNPRESFSSVAFLYDPVHGLLDMNQLLDPAAVAAGWTLDSVSDINNAGQIVGSARFQGMSHAVLLNRLAAPVPEPGTALMLAAGVALLAAGRRRFSR